MMRWRSIGRVMRCGALVLAVGMALPVWALDPNPPSIHSDRGAWPIRRQWTMDEVRHYAQWIEHIYRMKTTGTVEQRTAKIERVLIDPEMNRLLDPAFLGAQSNPQIPASLMRFMHNHVDCAKLSVMLPAYYAYRRALPWMTAYVRPVDGGDVRSSAANIPVGYESSFKSGSVTDFFQRIIVGISSGNYRVEVYGRNAHWSDSVPVALHPDYLMPGAISYMDGHTLILGRVTEYGELRFLHASTTRTRDLFTYNGMNAVSIALPAGSGPESNWEGCFQGLRIYRYPIAETDSRGRVINVRRRTDEEMKAFGFSLEQYEGLHRLIESSHLETDGMRPRSMHDFIRLRMKRVDSIAPVPFMETYADELVTMYELREEFVQDAWRDFKANGPVVYPEERSDENIFQAFGRWETWSSPSSDVDRRNMYFYLADWIDYALRSFGMNPRFVELRGLEKYTIRTQADLAAALVKEKQRIFASRAIHYTNSKGEKVRLTLAEIEARLYDLSFDPNHPPELRWGAPPDSDERASAPQTYTPLPDGTRLSMEESYRLQTYYRTVGQRETETSYLRGMFTEGFPLRKKFDDYMTLWQRYDQPTDALREWIARTETRPAQGAYTTAAD